MIIHIDRPAGAWRIRKHRASNGLATYFDVLTARHHAMHDYPDAMEIRIHGRGPRGGSRMIADIWTRDTEFSEWKPTNPSSRR